MKNNYKIDQDLIDNTIYNLKIISSLQETDKLNYNDNFKLEIDNTYFLRPLYRWWLNSNRINTINIIQQTVNNTIQITDFIFKNELCIQKNEKEREQRLNTNRSFFRISNSNLLKMFLIEITNVLKGIDNLKKTYNGDTTILTELDIIQHKLKLRLEKLNDKLQIIIE